MLIRDVARLAVISFLLFFQCVSLGFAAQVQTSPVRNPTGTAEKRGEQARRSDDLGQSSTVSATKVGTYDQLLTAIRGARTESRARVEKAVEQERVREAWEIGRLIDAHVLQHKERADYGKQVILRLSKDLGMSDTELYYMLQFARTYPNFRAPGKLSWANYETLLSVNDPDERAELEEKAAKENWTQDQVRAEVRKRKAARNGMQVPKKEAKLTAKPGIPHTYRVVCGTEESERVLDLGFSNYLRLSEVVADTKAFKEGDVVTSSQDPNGKYSLELYSPGRVVQNSPVSIPINRSAAEIGAVPTAIYKEKAKVETGSTRATEPGYTYEIKVLEVIDGDTIKAVVDLGFGFRTVQKLRLRGIDAPEIATADGMGAKKALEKMLGKNSPILIKTVKSDKYDRYLADVFVSSVYVNQKLLDEGYAVKVAE
ncbi:MAG: DUF1016 N-terminal domain-containing protein [Candidatus Omnitrophota bacterium]|jgi:endonuclease YncB( thermonuclease family)